MTVLELKNAKRTYEQSGYFSILEQSNRFEIASEEKINVQNFLNNPVIMAIFDLEKSMIMVPKISLTNKKELRFGLAFRKKAA